MRASGAMQDRINEHNHVDIHYNTAVDDVMGDSKGVTGLKIRKTDSGMSLANVRKPIDWDHAFRSTICHLPFGNHQLLSSHRVHFQIAKQSKIQSIVRA